MLTDQQRKVLEVLAAHADAGGEGVGTTEIIREYHERNNPGTRSFLGYDALHAVLKRMSKRGLVSRGDGRPARWSISADGRAEITA